MACRLHVLRALTRDFVILLGLCIQIRFGGSVFGIIVHDLVIQIIVLSAFFPFPSSHAYRI